MSTKALRGLLMKVRNGMHPYVEETEAAQAEVEAIEKNCRIVDEYGVVQSMRYGEDRDDDELDAAADYLCAIGRPEGT